LFSLVGMGQGNIVGSINDSQTGESLIGATVYISELDKGTMTDLDGNFQVSNVPQGYYTIEFRFIGYNNQTRNVRLEKMKYQG